MTHQKNQLVLKIIANNNLFDGFGQDRTDMNGLIKNNASAVASAKGHVTRSRMWRWRMTMESTFGKGSRFRVFVPKSTSSKNNPNNLYKHMLNGGSI